MSHASHGQEFVRDSKNMTKQLHHVLGVALRVTNQDTSNSQLVTTPPFGFFFPGAF